MKIWLDTNFLIYAAEKKVDYIEEIDNLINKSYQLITPSTVIKELEKISKGKGKDNLAAELALKIIEKNNIKEIKTDKLVDVFMIKNIKQGDILASMDRKLIKKIKNKKLTISKSKKIKIN